MATHNDTAEYLTVGTDDLQLYFSGTFLKMEVPTAGIPKQWAYIASFGLDETLTKGRRTLRKFVTCKWPKAPAKVEKYWLDDVQFDFSFPRTGLYNHKGSAVMVHRSSQRQNKKGLCSGTMEVRDVSSTFERHGVYLPATFHFKQMWRWSLPNVTKVFGHEEMMELPTAFQKIKRMTALARAISPNFFVGQGITDQFPSLWYHTHYIGRLLSEERLAVENTIFLPEVLDFFVPQGVTIETTDAA